MCAAGGGEWYSWTAAANASSPDLGSWPSGSQNDLPVSFWICQRGEKAVGKGAGARPRGRGGSSVIGELR